MTTNMSMSSESLLFWCVPVDTQNGTEVIEFSAGLRDGGICCDVYAEDDIREQYAEMILDEFRRMMPDIKKSADRYVWDQNDKLETVEMALA